MKTKSLPSLYRYVIDRLSTVAVSTLVPALNVLSTTLPESTFFNVVRTNAPPLPGLTCWNSTTAQSSPSRLRTRPFLRSLVEAISCLDLQLADRPTESTCRDALRAGTGTGGRSRPDAWRSRPGQLAVAFGTSLAD